MRHLKKGRKLNRTAAHRRAMFANMAASLFKHERIQTTLAKAKELRSFCEKLITRAKENTLHNKRIVLARIRDMDAVVKLFDEIAPRYKDVPGGYTRIVRVKQRHGDGAKMAIIELVQKEST